MDYDTQLINLALDAGEIMLASGAETFRVQDTMQRILSVSGKEKIEALAMCTLLMVTLPREEKGPPPCCHSPYTTYRATGRSARSVRGCRFCRPACCS